MEKKEDLLRLLISRPTREILKFLDQHEQAQYRELSVLVAAKTLNVKLRGLLFHQLIEHHLERLEVRREWYELTDKGRKVLQFLRELAEIVESEKEEDLFNTLSQVCMIEILEFLNEREQTQYKDMTTLASVHTLNERLRDLLKFGFIEHHLERIPLRREWYEVTEKGKKVVERLRILLSIEEKEVSHEGR